jgi:MFS family permease
MEDGFLSASPSLAGKMSGQVKHTFRALNQRNFRLYYGGQLISLSGTWMQNLALSWLVYRLTQSSMEMAKVDFCSQLPVLLLALFGGWLADRFDRRFILVTAQLTMMVQSALLAYLVFSAQIQFWQVLCLAILAGLVSPFEMPARQSLIAAMVEREYLVNAISLNSTAFNASKVAGPALAAFLVTIAGEAWCFAINSVSYIGSLAALLLMRLPPRRNDQKVKTNNFLDGIKFALSHREICPILRMTATMSLFGAQFFLLLPIVAREVLHGAVDVFGLLRVSGGIGSLIGALILADRGSPATLHKAVGFCCIGFPVGLVLFSFSHSLIISLVLMFVLGLSLTSQLSASNSLLQLNCPDFMRGRIMSLWTLTFMGVAPLGSLLTGYLAAWLGVMPTICVSGIACLVSAIVFVLFRK